MPIFTLRTASCASAGPSALAISLPDNLGGFSRDSFTHALANAAVAPPANKQGNSDAADKASNHREGNGFKIIHTINAGDSAGATTRPTALLEVCTLSLACGLRVLTEEVSSCVAA